MGTLFNSGSPENYTIGGIRLFFDETLTDLSQRGLIYLGNIVSASIQQEIDELEHFSAQTGTRIKDRSLVREVSLSIPFTFDEPNVENLNYIFFGAETIGTVAADTSTGNTENIFADTTTPIFVAGLRNADVSSVTVQDITLVTTYVLGTDYNLQQVGTMVGIEIISGGAITDGEELVITFDNNLSSGRSIDVLGKTLREGNALLQAVSDVGNEFEWAIPKVSLKPDGDISYNDEDWSEFQGILEILADTVNNPALPYGQIKHLGTGSDL